MVMVWPVAKRCGCDCWRRVQFVVWLVARVVVVRCGAARGWQTTLGGVPRYDMRRHAGHNGGLFNVPTKLIGQITTSKLLGTSSSPPFPSASTINRNNSTNTGAPCVEGQVSALYSLRVSAQADKVSVSVSVLLLLLQN